MVLAFFPPVRSDPKLVLRRLYLRPPARSDWADWAELRSESRDFLEPWEPTWARDALSRSAFRRRLARYADEWSRDQGYSFFLFRRVDDAIVGGITVSNVRRGVAQSCSFGYWVGQRHARKGYMTEAVRGACGFAFDRLDLHRVEAACLPSNAASRGVLANCGFRQEGLARRYLKIDGNWRDHLLFALLRDEFRAGDGDGAADGPARAAVARARGFPL